MTDKLIVACALVLAACYAWMTEQVTVLPFGDPLGPRAFPRILTVALLIAVALLLFEMFFSKGGKKSDLALAAPPAGDPPQNGRDTRWVVPATVVATTLYFFLFEPLGFVISSSGYLLAMTMYFNPGKTVANVLVSLLLPIACYLIFNNLLGVQLAPGILPL